MDHLLPSGFLLFKHPFRYPSMVSWSGNFIVAINKNSFTDIYIQLYNVIICQKFLLPVDLAVKQLTPSLMTFF